MTRSTTFAYPSREAQILFGVKFQEIMEIMKHLIAATTLALAIGACTNEDEAARRAEERAAVQALEAQRDQVTKAMEMRWEARSKEPGQAEPSSEE